MIKSISKIILCFVLMIAVALGSGYISYLITTNVINNKNKDKNNSYNELKIENENIAVDTTNSEKSAVSLEYYIVRLEGENLGIYACCDDREEFLYNESIYIQDLSNEDLQLLKNGVKLQNNSELTEFMENFTS